MALPIPIGPYKIHDTARRNAAVRRKFAVSDYRRRASGRRWTEHDRAVNIVSTFILTVNWLWCWCVVNE